MGKIGFRSRQELKSTVSMAELLGHNDAGAKFVARFGKSLWSKRLTCQLLGITLGVGESVLGVSVRPEFTYLGV